jgi:hypothetical protein
VIVINQLTDLAVYACLAVGLWCLLYVINALLEPVSQVFYRVMMDRLDRQRMVRVALAAGPLPGDHMARLVCGYPGHAGLRPEQDQQLHQAMLWSMWRGPL